MSYYRLMMSHYRRLIRFGYPLPTREGRQPSWFAMRDEGAAALITSALVGHGFRLTDYIFNYPGSKTARVPIDKEAFRPDDLLLLTTRPPLMDDESDDRKRILRSYIDLEQCIFDRAIVPLVGYCTRTEVKLTDAAVAQCADLAPYQAMEFLQHKGPGLRACASLPVRSFVRFKDKPARTMGFMAFVEHLWEGGPAALVAWGMGGRATMIWCRKLVTEFPHLLLTTSFVMAELREGKPVAWPDTLTCVDNWKARIVGAIPLPPKPGLGCAA